MQAHLSKKGDILGATLDDKNIESLDRLPELDETNNS